VEPFSHSLGHGHGHLRIDGPDPFDETRLHPQQLDLGSGGVGDDATEQDERGTGRVGDGR
jgi:hypothetical protein